MTDSQWNDLLRVLDGQRLDPLPVGLIVDSPWLPGWAGMSILDYLTDDGLWMEANLKAIRRFPDVMFLPGFWAEYGMCTEPSAFGAKCVFPENEFPFAEKVLADHAQIAQLKKPRCKTDGLLPLVIKRLAHCRPKIEAAGHRIRFAVARGPLNVASFLLGHTEFLVGVRTEPEATHNLLRLITDFLIEWLGYQAAAFPTIDGVLVLDDMVGFLRDADVREFVVPYLKEIYGSLPAAVKAFHNDAHGMVGAKYLAEIGVNLFNFSFEHPLGAMREAVGEKVVLLGNLPPRDVLAGAAADEVARQAAAMVASAGDARRIVFSCGGGTPPDVPTENIEALCRGVRGSSVGSG